MNNLDRLNSKICSLKTLNERIEKWKKNKTKIVFTNGCFDLVHRGHIEVLSKMADLGDKLIIGINSDNSIRRLKGKERPIVDELSRSMLLASFSFVDAIILFDEETPINLISEIIPDILSKGGDYNIDDIVGYEIVRKNGGKIITVDLTDGFSTTNIVNKISKDK